MTTCNCGLRVVGGTRERREVIDASRALTAYCQSDDAAEVDRETYLTAFWFPREFQTYFNQNGGSEKGYAGVCWQPYANWDIDSPDLDKAHIAARRLCTLLIDRYNLDDDVLLIFFSGSKGFHVCLETSLWLPEPSADYHQVARCYAEQIARQAGVKIDTGVYNQVRLWRAPNSKHPKTGLHKRRLSYAELMWLRLERIVELAREPLPFDDVLCGFGVNDTAIADWKAAEAEVREQSEVGNESLARSGSEKLNRLTLDIIRDYRTLGTEADTGDRHRLLLSAAANCGEFPTVAALTHALLTEPGRDSGLSPKEVYRQIEMGLERGRAKS